MTTREALLLANGTIVHENLPQSDRLISITARNAGDKNAGTVFVDIWNADQGLISLGFHRADFYRAIQRELGLIDPFEAKLTFGVDWDEELRDL